MDKVYLVTMSHVRKMLEQGLISADEYTIIDTMLREKYGSKIGTLFVDLLPDKS